MLNFDGINTVTHRVEMSGHSISDVLVWFYATKRTSKKSTVK